MALSRPQASNDEQPALYQGTQAAFIPAGWPGRNTSGLLPHGKQILVRMDEAAASKNGVLYTDERTERMSMASETGCIYAVGPDAYRLYEDGQKWTGYKPQAGERVFVERHSGTLARGFDGAMYRFMDSRCIAGGLDPDFVPEDEQPA